MSVRFYDENAEQFFAQTLDADMTDARQRFLSHMRQGGRILDAGCGSGRDAKAFAELGYTVEAFDASAEMARIASRHTGMSVRQLTFEEISWTHEFDGVWASASLLHVPRNELCRIIGQLTQALKPGGVLYASFKHGTTEREKVGRHFTDMTEETLADELSRLPQLHCLDMWVSEDVRPNRSGEFWISTIVRCGPPSQ
jgi:2-polyprenyl-3-methyl-5-hydroxy-6-metoxy-1,4-benzoquinol methylase